MKQNVIWNRIRRTLASRQGMTMVELLVVVAIIGILSGVGFVSVGNYQRSMAQLERDGIAKEIFVAAQNHLTAAQGQGYLSQSGYGTKGTLDDDKDGEGNYKDVYYYVVTRGSISDNGAEAFSLMLPFGAIDETVRAGGSYLIRYQPKTATVLDVFYCSTSGSPDKFNCELNKVDDVYTSVMGLRNDKNGRRTYTEGGNSVLGYYGGAQAEELATMNLKAPAIQVDNGNQLKVTVTDTNSGTGGAMLQLLVEGVSSGAQKAFPLTLTSTSNGRITPDSVNGKYEIILDDITSTGKHFCEIPADTEGEGKLFIPGEDVKIYAVAYSTSTLANIAYSTEKITNSLFADGTTTTTAQIGSFRHLENLDSVVSGLDNNDTGNKINIGEAVQIQDLNWTTFNSTPVYVYNATSIALTTQPGYYYPINPDYNLIYDGKNHSISGVMVDSSKLNGSYARDDAGLFGSASKVSAISNLELIDFTITGTNSAGALAGKLSGCAVTNVLARNSAAGRTITASAGAAGGLIGVQYDGSVNNSAAALTVSGSTNAGGLIGTCTGAVTGCYSGGHTKDGSYQLWLNNATPDNNADDHPCDVTGETAGGLIGDAGTAVISKSYSTCSVSGTTAAGGFVGSASGSISNCYCTGLVSGTGDNAFIGSGTLTTNTGNQYYKIVNEMITYDGDGMITAIAYKEPGADGITAIDADNDSFNTFVGGASDWTSAAPYDATLNNNYGGRFNLKTVGELGASVSPTDFVNTHYGDWPSPELFFVNTPTSS